MVEYPQSIPLLEIKSIIDVVRNGKLKEDLPTVAKSGWIVQGFAQKMLIGEPGSTPPSTPDFSLTSQSSVDIMAELEKFVAKVESGETTAQISIPWDLVAQWVLKLLLDLIQEKLS